MSWYSKRHHPTSEVFYTDRNIILTLQSPTITILVCTTSLTFSNSPFCPHSVFMCFLWISEQTAIVFLYSINWLVFITEIYPFKAQWSLYVPPVLTFNNSTSCPHSVFMCFVWFSEQTAIISLYSNNWLVFISEIYPFKAPWSLYVPPV
jgi:hypothetical protein